MQGIPTNGSSSIIINIINHVYQTVYACLRYINEPRSHTHDVGIISIRNFLSISTLI